MRQRPWDPLVVADVDIVRSPDVGADAVWMALGTTVRNTNVDMNQGAFAFYGLRSLGPAADLTFGLRVKWSDPRNESAVRRNDHVVRLACVPRLGHGLETPR